MKTLATRYHDFSTGHRVYGHESKCAHFHGHNYRVYFTIESPELDTVGRVLDFSVIKDLLCEWLEENWDHKFIVFNGDPAKDSLIEADPEGIVVTEYNPTAENLAEYLLKVVGPEQLKDTSAKLTSVVMEETRKCKVEVSL